MADNPFDGKVVTTASLWDEDEQFVKKHVLAMGGSFRDTFAYTINCLVYDPENDFKTKSLEKAEKASSEGQNLEIMQLADFQKIVYEYIMQKKTDSGNRNIENNEFYGFSKLTEIRIPEGAEYVGDYAFYGCEGITEIHIPSSVSVIGERAFQGCCNLKSIVIPEGVMEIKEAAFNTEPLYKTDSSRLGWPYQRLYEKSRLESVSIPKSLEIIEEGAFKNSFYTDISIYDSLKGLKDNLWDCEPDKINFNKYYYAFRVSVLNEENGNIKYVVPMYSDGTDAMMQCLKGAWNKNNGEFDFIKLDAYFRKIKKPDIKVIIAKCRLDYPTDLSDGNFKMYKSYLKRTEKSIDTKPVKDPDYEMKGSKLVRYKGNKSEVVVPLGVKEIGKYAFHGDEIKKIVLPDGVVAIECGDNGTFDCKNLEQLVIPDSLTNMPYGAVDYLRDSGKLKYNKYDNGLYLGNDKNPYVCLVKTADKDVVSIIVPDGCKIICGYAFVDCLKLERIVLPDSIVYIEDEERYSIYSPYSASRKNIYLQRKLNMNLPAGYLRRSVKLPNILTYDLVTTKWRDSATVEDFAWLYLFQSSKPLDELCEKKMMMEPQRATEEMCTALIKNPRKASYKKAAEFVRKNKNSVDGSVITRLYENAVSAKAEEAAALFKGLKGSSKKQNQGHVVVEHKHVTIDKCKLVIADGVNIIPKGFLDSYCKKRIKEIQLPDSVKYLDESVLPDNIIINMPKDYAMSKEKIPAKFTCSLLSGPWYKLATIKDYTYFYLYQGGTFFNDLCLFELLWDPDKSVKEMIEALKNGGERKHYLKVAEFIADNQVYISKDTTNEFLELAVSAKVKKAVDIVELTLGKGKKNIWDSRKDVDIFCHENFSDYHNRKVLEESFYDFSYAESNIRYKDSEDYVPDWVIRCVVAPYLSLFKSVDKGVELRLIDTADTVVDGLDLSSLSKVLSEVTNIHYAAYPQNVIPLCRFADEKVVEEIIDNISYVRTHPAGNRIGVTSKEHVAIEKEVAALESEALLLNNTEVARNYAKSVGRIKEYEQIHGKEK